MKDIYVEKFSEVIETTQRRTGYPVSWQMKSYLSYLLADHVERTDFWSESVALRYLALEAHHRHSAKDLADNCLVLTGIFPEFGNRRGLNVDYYAEIGAASYGIAADATGSAILAELHVEFYTLTENLFNGEYFIPLAQDGLSIPLRRRTINFGANLTF